MKFPLAERPFMPLQLSPEYQHALITLTDQHLVATLAEYETLRHELHGEVDSTKWKHVRKKHSIDIYQWRGNNKAKQHQEKQPANLTVEEEIMQLQNPTTDKDSSAILWYGTMKGNLHDVMYGVVAPTVELMKLKSIYVPDNFADRMVLATVIEATPSDPFRGLFLKWGLGLGPKPVRPFVRPRDSAFVEATGITRTDSGERIGYHFFHTLTIPGVRELHELKVVRCTMSAFHLFRQKEDGVVEVYVRSSVDLLGDIPPTVAILSIGEAVASLTQTPVFAEVKKLIWLMKTQKVGFTLNANQQSCFGCQKRLPIAHHIDQSNVCYVCMGRMCSRCRVVKKLYFLAGENRDTVQQSIVFCRPCVESALHTDGLIVASDEISRELQRNAELFELESITDSSSRPSTSSFSAMRWVRSLSRASIE